jgi:hypothetical protein
VGHPSPPPKKKELKKDHVDNYEVSSGKNSSNKDKQKDSQNFLILSFVLWSNSGLHYEQKLLGHG